jgi:hypothetical protein
MRRWRSATGTTVADDNETYQTRDTRHLTWSPAQLVAIVLGLIFVVLGGVALARTGIHLDSLTGQHVRVAGAGHTQLLGYIELGYGILLLASGSAPGASRGLMSFLALAALAFGFIVAIQPSSFRHSLGINGSGYGVFLVIVGVVALLTAVAAPVFGGSSLRRSALNTRHLIQEP